jgi:hypothetical protein
VSGKGKARRTEERTLAPEASNPRNDQARVALEKILRVEAETLEHSRAERVDEDVGAPVFVVRGGRQKLANEGNSFGRFEGDGDGALSSAAGRASVVR